MLTVSCYLVFLSLLRLILNPLEAGDCHHCLYHSHLFIRFSSSEFLENIEELFDRYYIRNDMFVVVLNHTMVCCWSRECFDSVSFLLYLLFLINY